MGTRFMCTIEAPIHHNVKQEIVNAQETDTELVLRRWKNTSRLYANKVAKEAVKAERESVSGKFEDVAEYVSGKRGREVFINGDVDHGVWTAGQVIGLIHGLSFRISKCMLILTSVRDVIDIPSCKDLIQRIECDAEETLKKATSLIIESEDARSIADSSPTSTSTSPDPPTGTVGKNMNNPGAEIWGVGKSKL